MKLTSKQFPGDQGRQHAANLQPPVDSKLTIAVQAFLEAHDQLDGKYWPMLNIFLERLGKEIPLKKITGDFHRVFRECKKLEPKEEIPAYWYARVHEVQQIALKGKDWVKKHKAKGFGFWKLLELAKFESGENSKEVTATTKEDTKRRLRDRHFAYFLQEHPAQFPFLFECFTDPLNPDRLPNLERDPHKELKAYERMCVRLLDRLLRDSTFFFSAEYNWPRLCQQILEQVRPKRPVIMDMETL